MDWFTVDKEGLAKTLARRSTVGAGGITGIAWLLYELLQNAWDTDATEVAVVITPVKGKPLAEIVVTDDDHEGFADLSHAFTLFAESVKKGDPEKRGRFNLGEKLVLALCEEAKIISTKGSVVFDKDGRRLGREKTERGSKFMATVRLTRDEYEQVLRGAKLLIPPHDKRTTVNGEELDASARVSGFRMTLPTEKADADGFLRRTRRETLVQLHECKEGPPFLFEMGIPVVELAGGEPWHVNIHQKIPLNADRDNVTPAYLRELRTEMLNRMHKEVKGADDATKAWVRDAAGDPKASKEAVEHVKTERFGERAVAFDPSDPEGTKMAAAEGYTVIPGGSLSKGEWDNLKRDSIVLPAGQVTPSQAEATADASILSPDGETDGMKRMRVLVQSLGRTLLDCEVCSIFIESDATVLATYGRRQLTFNVTRLKERWFDHGPTEAQVDLVLHELGHHLAADHLSKKYNDALTMLGAKLAFHVADHPTFFKEHAW